MKSLTQKIRHVVFGNKNPVIRRRGHPFDYIKTKKGILRELIISQESGNLIGLISPALGEGMFFILVLSIERQNSEEMVVIQKCNVSDGRALSTMKLNLHEIEAACPFIRDRGAAQHSAG
jgi:hypothetical protein